jgi:monovalent cation:H+ antiporter-2, CPA2 family
MGGTAQTHRARGLAQTRGVESSAPEVLELGILLALAALAGWLARRLGLPAVIGYLAVGLIVSPFTPGYVVDRAHLLVLADIGVVLLLFEVGLEIDPLRVRHTGALLWLAPLQVVISLGAGIGIGFAAGLDVRGGLLLGLAVALSSSAVVVSMTHSRRSGLNRETESALLTWSVLQDIVGVAAAMGLLASLNAGSTPVALTVAGIALFIAISLVAAWVLPRLLVSLRPHPDLFLVLAVGAGLLLAGVGARFFALPIALAAFVAGLAVGEGPVATEARQRLAPLREVFAVLFFVSIGTLIDPTEVPAALAWFGILAGLIIVAKVGVIYVTARAFNRGAVRAGRLAVGLGQVGEFSFVLGSVGAAAGVIPMKLYTALLAAVVVSIAASTVGVQLRSRPASTH